ncbi:nucleotide-binding alpha-beta plait domain-containing protein, partial [Tanacetum coccineum]
MVSQRTKEDALSKISTLIFVTNFPETFSAKDLFITCKQYGHVVDTYIPLKRSKAGKRFGFVRFVNVFSVERLVNNLCMIWIDKYKLQANTTRFQRPSLNSKASVPTFVGGGPNDKDSPGLGFEDDFLKTKLCLIVARRIAWVEIEGIPLKLWSDNTFKRIAAKWRVMLDIDDQDDDSKESPGWVPDFTNEEDDEDISDVDYKDGAVKVDENETDGFSDVEGVPETVLEDDESTKKHSVAD